jgi:hypothetical protein
MKWLLFIRWSEVEMIYEFFGDFPDQDAAIKEGENQKTAGALAYRTELRQLPASPKKTDAKKTT